MVIQTEPILFQYEMFKVSKFASNKILEALLAQDPYEKLLDMCIKQ